MPLLLKNGDVGSHGGSVVSSAIKTKLEGALVVLVGDTLNCSVHGSVPIVNPISTKTYAEGKLIALDGAVAACGAVISSSAIKTLAE